jgi:hypothetical protein
VRLTPVDVRKAYDSAPVADCDTAQDYSEGIKVRRSLYEDSLITVENGLKLGIGITDELKHGSCVSLTSIVNLSL